MVSAICPKCHILLVEAKSSSLANLGAAVNEAAKLGATEISNSYGGSESSSDTSYDSTYYNHPGVAITASSGDGGYGVEYPAASKYVTAVGGTTLTRSSATRGLHRVRMERRRIGLLDLRRAAELVRPGS